MVLHDSAPHGAAKLQAVTWKYGLTLKNSGLLRQLKYFHYFRVLSLFWQSILCKFSLWSVHYFTAVHYYSLYYKYLVSCMKTVFFVTLMQLDSSMFMWLEGSDLCWLYGARHFKDVITYSRSVTLSGKEPFYYITMNQARQQWFMIATIGLVKRYQLLYVA